MNRRYFFKNALALLAGSTGSLWVAGPRGHDAEGREFPIRPPGARREAEFLSRCIRCLRCSHACPNQAIQPLDENHGRERAGTPAIQPRRQACMLCNKAEGSYLRCTEACPSGALEVVRKEPAEVQARVSMGKAELDKQLCYSYNNWSCGACYRACPFPEKAMMLGLWERPEVNPRACVGCGLCERACIRYPQAIRVRAKEGAA